MIRLITKTPILSVAGENASSVTISFIVEKEVSGNCLTDKLKQQVYVEVPITDMIACDSDEESAIQEGTIDWNGLSVPYNITHFKHTDCECIPKEDESKPTPTYKLRQHSTSPYVIEGCEAKPTVYYVYDKIVQDSCGNISVETITGNKAIDCDCSSATNGNNVVMSGEIDVTTDDGTTIKVPYSYVCLAKEEEIEECLP